MSPKVDEIVLSNGYKVPVLGLGTWQGAVSVQNDSQFPFMGYNSNDFASVCF